MKFLFATAAALMASAALPGAAQASVTINSITGNPGFETGKIIYTPGGIGGAAGTTSLNVEVGRIRLSGTDNDTNAAVSFDAYCIDIFNYVQNGSFTIEPFALADPIKQAQLMTLLTHTASFIDDAATLGAKKDISAAIQMAVWEIAFESGTSGYSLDNGLFQMGTGYGSVLPSARGQAQSYLDGLDGWTPASGYGLQMMVAENPTSNQRQVFLVETPVPEPSTWAMMLAGFFLLGGTLRTRSRKTAPALA